MKIRAKWKLALLMTAIIGIGVLCLKGWMNNTSKNVVVDSNFSLLPVDKRLTPAYNEFGFQLFKQLLRHEKDGNILISPLSIATVLAMTCNGAAGETRSAIAKTLNLRAMKLQEVNQASSNLQKNLQNGDPKVELTIANSLWARQGFEFKPEFLQANRKYYNAEVSVLNFNDPQAPSTINEWVSRATRGKIERIVDRTADRPDALTMMILINAIYFKGEWQEKFDKSLTEDGEFHLQNGHIKQMPFMSQGGDYEYAHLANERFAAVALPYGAGHMSFYIFLPDKGVRLSTLLQKLNRKNWDRWLNEFSQQEGTVKLPRFKLEYEANLKKALSALGMKIAFDGRRADFTNMFSVRPAWIDRVQHYTVMEVNEEGTEAAAATEETAAANSAPVEGPFTFTADRPFFCAIRDNHSGSILFMSAVLDPQ